MHNSIFDSYPEVTFSASLTPGLVIEELSDPPHFHKFQMESLDQRSSNQFFVAESSLPYEFNSFDDLSPSLAASLSSGDLSMSPAAMFLSAFSPSSMSCAPLPDDEGQIIAGHVLGPIVGHGGFSTIRTATSPSGDTVAVKIVRRSDVTKQENPEVTRRRLDQEAQVWGSLHHEHILPLFKPEHTPYADFFITQYCPAGSLFDILKRDGRPALPQDDVGTMFRQVVRGLQYMHEVAGYVHGDIKLENVMVDEMGVCKIGDFGMARKIGLPEHDQHYFDETRKSGKQGLHTHLSLIRHTKAHGSRNTSRHRASTPVHNTLPPSPSQVYQQGSLPYAAPELLLPQIGAPYLPHPAQDIWALGVMLYTLLTGRLPFMDSFEPRLQMKILHGVFEMPKAIGRGAERVLKGCMEPSLADRWTISMVDEVGWGVGWGEEGDGATADHEECTSSRRSTSVVASRSHSRASGHSAVPETSASSRTRSSSRSSSRSVSRSGHRDHPRYIPPSLSALTTSILGPSISPDVSPSLPVLSRSNSEDNERGRRLTKSIEPSNSRSASPSVAPMTPTDPSDTFRSFFPMNPRTSSEEWSPGYDRARYASPHIRGRRAAVELADIEGNVGWSDKKALLWNVDWVQDASKEKSPRAGSVPRNITFSDIRETSSAHSKPVAIPRKRGLASRSKSLGYETRPAFPFK